MLHMRTCWRLALSHSLLRLSNSKPQFYPISIPSPLQLGFWSPLSSLDESIPRARPAVFWREFHNWSLIDWFRILSELLWMIVRCFLVVRYFFVNYLTEFPSLILTNFGWIFIFYFLEQHWSIFNRLMISICIWISLWVLQVFFLFLSITG